MQHPPSAEALHHLGTRTFELLSQDGYQFHHGETGEPNGPVHWFTWMAPGMPEPEVGPSFCTADLALSSAVEHRLANSSIPLHLEPGLQDSPTKIDAPRLSEKHQQGLLLIAAKLRAVSIRSCTMTYQGGGGEGSATSIVFAGVNGEPIDPPESLGHIDDAFEDFAWHCVEGAHGRFWIGEGAHGTVTLTVSDKSAAVYVRHADYVVVEQTSEFSQ